ncbi:peptidase M61 [Roseivirga pacifica]|uniref:M61 family metallopeptidase n=1 Tax=Roseivirga pacifica TaxID=1267423 RepID=UPI00209456D1|nr:peptidase M61 [Roseivirga pacifica]MCO6357559.1 peptidase M61 [Roseivirga pacifica]MCO6365812.1 peptidase M61 [Roseivirga pacifica]MCO6371141.1 peptidase M61 [Roseivirga pacifica]MCO6375688.1 peptidase M61 [Roseivirga pacifica]MCO6378519.1 peptidase M61 [Roseivirga pacifica]
MNRFLLSLVGLCLSITLFAAKPYKYTVDLTKVVDDKVYVELSTPKIRENEVKFYMPKIVPGTYAIADYGRMVSDLKAFDKRDNPITVERLDDNTWLIKDARKLRKLSYWVEDTYDTEKEGPEIFQPAGTNIEDDKNFVINTSGFFGYFEGMKKEEFEINVVRKNGFYGATGLKASNNPPMLGKLEIEVSAPNVGVDQFVVNDYDRLIDSPLMYSKADTAIIKVANTDVLVASYSPNKKITAKEIASSIEEVLAAQNEFLGGKLPVDKYAFIFYFTDEPILSYGALEHSYSSFYYMPESTIEQMNQQLRDFAAHEFFHIVTPLNIHSEEIGSFDFNAPKMSRHLWMYEGMTEYFAGSVQVKYGLVTPEEYLGMLTEKLVIAKQFKDELPFTELSLGALDEYADQYYNVYQKGALIGMALDIKLRELSNGAYGVQNMMADLSEEYGIDKSFKDDELFAEIVTLTYPEIGEFLNTYVAGSTPIPYKEIFEKVGVEMTNNGTQKQWSMGFGQTNISVVQHNGEQRLAIANDGSLNSLGQALGLKNGDIVLKMNGITMPPLGPEIQAFLSEQAQMLPELETFTYTVLREVDGKKQEVKLSAPNKQVDVPTPVGLRFMENPTEAQLKLRKYWLEPAN